MAKKKTEVAPTPTGVDEKRRAYVSQTDVPNNSLEDALRVPRALIDNYAGKTATPLQVASALNMTPSSGTFRNLCGSAIAYGLTAGGYNAKEITVEPLSKRILAPLAEGDDLVAKREAALKPRILGEFIRKYENSPLPRHDIALNVLNEMGVPRERTESVYTLILDTAQAVGLIREIKNKQYIDLSGVHVAAKLQVSSDAGEPEEQPPALPIETESGTMSARKELGQAIFVAHGKNKKTLEQLKRILEQFRIPYKVAIDEPNLGRPIGAKVKEIMESCNCAILIFTSDEEFQDKNGNSVWRPSENIVYELGASGYLYGSRIVILKEETVEFPTNFRDLGYISFAKDQLEAKSMDVLNELIGFGIVKIST
ncbi:MAG: nucleotide-binding protein [Deltaproteobacteria bacterium]|nr:nucleotide-binding protein [Deltaproteobacteria bacterium]